MKKLLAVIAIAGTIVACNNAGEGSNSGDTTIKSSDTSTVVTPNPADTAQVVKDTTIKVSTDTVNKTNH